MKIIKIFVVILFLFFTQTIFCQDESYQNFNNTFGLKLSNISGYGLYYNRKISDNFKIQVVGLVYYLYSLNNGIEHKNLNYEIGLEIQRKIVSGENGRIYFLAGAYYFFDDDSREGNGYLDKKINNSFNTGIGLAGEYYYKRFILSLELGYKFYEDRLEITNNNQVPYPELRREMKIGAGIGIGFMF